MNAAYLCLGGNIGNREALIEEALKHIDQTAGEITKKSSVYETEAWGVEHQQPYLNQCIKIRTALEPLQLLEKLLGIEQQMGRNRTNPNVYEPRTIDIDILFFNQEIIATQLLQVPHPRLQLRKFVLIPLNEIASEFLHPLLNKTIFSLLEECKDDSEVVLYQSKH